MLSGRSSKMSIRKTRLRFQRFLHWSLYASFVCAVFLVIAFAYYAMTAGGFLDALDTLNVTMTTAMLFHMLRKMKVISQNWNEFFVITNDMETFSKSVTRRCKCYVAATVFLFVCITLFIFIVSVPFSKNDALLSVYCFGCNVISFSEVTRVVFRVLHFLVLIFEMILPVMIPPTLVSCFLILVSELVKDINSEVRQISSSTHSLSYQDIVNIRKKYSWLQSFLLKTDDCLSGYLFMFFGASFISVCQGFSQIINYFDKSDLITLMWVAIICFLPLLYTFALSSSAAKIPVALSRGLYQVQDLSPTATRVDFRVYHELNLLLNQLSFRPNGVTIGNIVVVTNTVFMSYLAAVISYVIIYLQLFPELLKKLKGEL